MYSDNIFSNLTMLSLCNMTACEERFSHALHGAARSWRIALDRRLKYLGMSQASWLTIAVTARAKEALSQTELAQRLGVESATMVAMIDRLEKSGLVIRQPSTTDRRVKLVVLTPTGNQLYDQVKAQADAFRAELLADVDKTKLAIAAEVLEQLQVLMEAIHE